MKMKFKALALAAAAAFASIAPARAQSPEEQGYTLKQVFVLSRHNIRTPLNSYRALMDSLTTHKGQWTEWSAHSSELTLHGGVAETIMGQYFNEWLTGVGFIPRNWVPGEDEVLFYSNCFQRTVATARYFASGMLPQADIVVNHKNELDLLFVPVMDTATPEFIAQVNRERAAMGGPAGMRGMEDSLARYYRVLEKVLDYEHSDYCAAHGGIHFASDTIRVVDRVGKEPAMRCLLRKAIAPSDALVLQYYEEKDLRKAAFGHDLSFEEWCALARIKDIYEDLMVSPPTMAVNTHHTMLQFIKGEFSRKGRKFSFLCGHDSTIASVLAAIGAEHYVLPGAIEGRTPLGGKLVIERYSRGGVDYARLSMVYASSEQLRNTEQLRVSNPPMRYVLKLKGVESEGGFCRWEDFESRLDYSIAAYDGTPKGIAVTFENK